MTFWNKVYFHHYGYGSVWHLMARKRAGIRKSITHSLNAALGIKNVRRWKRQGKLVSPYQWKRYYVNITCKYPYKEVVNGVR